MNDILQSGQTPVVFSASPYWRILKRYYAAEGPEAWNGKVPYYATNNTRLAMSYAQAIVAYYLDWVAQNGPTTQPLPIIEIGAGSGRFGYYLLMALEKVAKLNRVPLQKFKLILCDFAKKNVDAWLGHSQFAPYFKKGMLDCVLFDIDSSESFYGLYGQAEMLPKESAIPPWVYGHYLFDSLPIDVFRVKASRLFAVHVSLQKKRESPYPDDDVRKIAFSETLCPFEKSQYDNPLYNQLVQSAAKELESGYFSFPIAAFNLLAKLDKLLPGGYVFSCMDKGFFDWNSYNGEKFPSVFYHNGAFSFDFNFCVLQDYLRQKSEQTLFFFTKRRLVKWAVFGCGFELRQLTELKKFGQLQLELSDPAEQPNLLTYAAKIDVPIEVLLGLLANSYWDPILLMTMGAQLIEKIADASWDEKVYLFSSLIKVEQHYFQAVDSGDLYRLIGRLYHQIGEYQEAISYLKRSQQLFGETYATHFALGKSYFSMGDSASALRHFTRAQKYRLTKQLKSWIQYLKKSKDN